MTVTAFVVVRVDVPMLFVVSFFMTVEVAYSIYISLLFIMKLWEFVSLFVAVVVVVIMKPALITMVCVVLSVSI